MELYFQHREEWRNWLRENSLTAREVWLIYYKKGSGMPRIPYNEAVEEALCFGWLNSSKKHETRERRIDKIISQSLNNRKRGM